MIIKYTLIPEYDWNYAKSPSIYYNNIIKLGKYMERSEAGGLTSDQIKNSSFVYLNHNTSISGLDKILNNGYLEHRLSLSKKGMVIEGGLAGSYPTEETIEKSAYNQRQFPGEYFYIISQRTLLTDTKLYEGDTSGEVIPEFVSLIFSLALLQQQNWHLNIQDQYGIINNDTFSAVTLPIYLHSIPTLWGKTICSAGSCTPELIFHDKISIDFIEGIVVNTIEDFSKCKEILSKYGLDIPIYIYSDDFKLSILDKQFIKNINNFDILDKSMPQLCYTNAASSTPYGFEGYEYPEEEEEMRPEEYRHCGMFGRVNPFTNLEAKTKEDQTEEDAYLWDVTLKNCSISEEYSYGKEEELYKKIEDRMQELYFGDAERLPPIYHPPFKYTPSYYL